MDKCDEVSEISLEIEKIGIAEAITVSNDDVDHKVIGTLPSDPETGEAKSVDGQVNGTVSEVSENDEGESKSSKTNGHVKEINGENEAVVNTDNSDTALSRSTECHDEIKDGDQGKRDDISIDSLDEDEFHDAVDEKSDNELGFCTQMCPESEIQFRVKNNLIHRLEEGKFMIKEYRRSAADTHDLDKPENLRSKSALSKTVSYLLKSVIRNQEFPFFDKYNFISDRIRAVRQELTIQRLSHTWFGLKVLIDCSNFYLVSRRIFINFRHEENFIDLPKFNEQHFQECIGTMIDFLKETPVEELFGTELGSTREAIAILLLASINKTASSNLIDFIFRNFICSCPGQAN